MYCRQPCDGVLVKFFWKNRIMTWPTWQVPQNQFGRQKKQQKGRLTSAAARKEQYTPSDNPEEPRSDDCNKSTMKPSYNETTITQ